MGEEWGSPGANDTCWDLAVFFSFNFLFHVALLSSTCQELGMVRLPATITGEECDAQHARPNYAWPLESWFWVLNIFCLCTSSLRVHSVCNIMLPKLGVSTLCYKSCIIYLDKQMPCDEKPCLFHSGVWRLQRDDSGDTRVRCIGKKTNCRRADGIFLNKRCFFLTKMFLCRRPERDPPCKQHWTFQGSKELNVWKMPPKMKRPATARAAPAAPKRRAASAKQRSRRRNLLDSQSDDEQAFASLKMALIANLLVKQNIWSIVLRCFLGVIFQWAGSFPTRKGRTRRQTCLRWLVYFWFKVQSTNDFFFHC